MIQDRPYMNNRGGGRPANNIISGMKCLYALICVNVIFFLLLDQAETPFYQLLALSSDCFDHSRYWQPLTAIFLHADFFHIFFNMFGLYMFGTLVAPALGGWRFLSIFLFSGVVGNLLWLSFNLEGFAYIVGASGSVMGVIMASAMIAPNQEVYLLFAPFPLKLKTMAIVFILLDVFCEFITPPARGSIAYLAHIGGFFSGYLYMRIWASSLVEWDFLSSILGAPKAKGWRIVTPPQASPLDSAGRVTQVELDRILDKISASGINSLSNDEMETLRKAREQMKGQS